MTGRLSRRRVGGKTAERRATVLLIGAPLLQVLAAVGAIPAQANITGANARTDDPGPWGQRGANVTLRVRGYIDDSCINNPKLDGCFTPKSPTVFRSEASAQALAINALALLHGDPLKNTVAWEVGPRSASEPNRFVALEPPGEPLDPCDPLLPGYTDSERWRIDIVVNHRSMIEVKNWKASAAQVEVENQLNCYREKAAAVGVTFADLDRSVELQTLNWAAAFTDQAGTVYCTWAGDLAGHIYFAPIGDATLPPDAATRCGGPQLQPSSVLDKWNQVMAAIAAARVVAEKTGPVAIPGRQRVPVGNPAAWNVQVLKSESANRRLDFDFGDGTSVSRLIPSGSGVVSFPLTKVFTAPGAYIQRAGVIDLSLAKQTAPAAAATSMDGVPTTETLTEVGTGANTPLAAGGNHSLALKNDGTVWAWGMNNYGELGNGTTTQSATPVAVSGLSGITALAAGYDHSLALKDDGTVWAWGNNSSGELGNATTAYGSTPVAVSGLTGVTALAAGYDHSLALKGDGTVWTWGHNAHGLGDGTTTQSSTPVAVSGLSGVIALAAGYYHSLAVKSDGSVWAWAFNFSGQLGDGTTIERTTPVAVSGLSGVIALAAGGYHSLALKSDGTVWSWGYNYHGELGNNSSTPSSIPVVVSGLSGIAALAAGGYHSLALKGDGTVLAWGYNGSGQLGNATGIESSTPVAASGVSGVTALAAGAHHTLALKGDGRLWAWGYNWNGQLGNGTTTDSSTPVAVAGQDWGLPPPVGGPTPGGRYTALTPARILDTRDGTGGISGAVGPGSTSSVQVTGRGAVPATGVSAVAMNVTVTQPTGDGYLTLYPAGTTRPLAANLNFTPGKTVPNLVVVKLGTNGKVDMFNSAGTTDVIYDLTGYFTDSSAGNNGRYVPLTPARILDTRSSVRLAPGVSLDLQVAGQGGVPGGGAEAMVMNVAVTNTDAVSYLTVFPTGEARPLAANLNWAPGDTLSNRVIAKLGANGRVTLYNNAGKADVVVDVNGWFTDASQAGAAGVYTPLTPARILDTRDGTGGITTRPGGSTVDVQVTGAGGVPTTGVSAVILNATVVNPTAPGYLTVFPAGTARPLASDLNYATAETRPNLVVVKVGSGGKVGLFTPVGTDVVFDVAGWFGS